MDQWIEIDPRGSTFRVPLRSGVTPHPWLVFVLRIPTRQVGNRRARRWIRRTSASIGVKLSTTLAKTFCRVSPRKDTPTWCFSSSLLRIPPSCGDLLILAFLILVRQHGQHWFAVRTVAASSRKLLSCPVQPGPPLRDVDFFWRLPTD